jgi:hypothetical protein
MEVESQATASTIEPQIQKIQMSPLYSSLCMALSCLKMSSLSNPEIENSFENFCIKLSSEQTSKYEKGKAFIVYGKILLTKMARGDLEAYATSKDAEEALTRLHLQICKSLILGILSNIDRLSQKKYKNQHVNNAIHQFEHRFNPDQPGNVEMLKKSLEALLSSDLGSYYKPSKDPLKINLLNSLECVMSTIS